MTTITFSNHGKLAFSFVFGACTFFLALKLKQYFEKRKKQKKTLLDCVGNTPLIYLPRLSKAINC